MHRCLLVALLLVGPTACDGPSEPPPSADLADPASVLSAYLLALGTGDCATGRTFAEPSFQRGNGELCGAVQVSAIKVNWDPARAEDERVYATTLTTSGSADGSIAAGDTTWFYDLKRQADGTWLIAGGGSGP